MSTRCNIEIYDNWNTNKPGVILYHHSDGYPEFMQGKLERFLKAAYEWLKEAGYPYWWDSERVGAVLIALSIEDYKEPLKPFSTDRKNEYDYDKPHRPNNSIPVFQPCLELHGDINYVWEVHLLTEQGEFTIKYREV